MVTQATFLLKNDHSENTSIILPNKNITLSSTTSNMAQNTTAITWAQVEAFLETKKAQDEGIAAVYGATLVGSSIDSGWAQIEAFVKTKKAQEELISSMLSITLDDPAMGNVQNQVEPELPTNSGHDEGKSDITVSNRSRGRLY